MQKKVSEWVLSQGEVLEGSKDANITPRLVLSGIQFQYLLMIKMLAVRNNIS